MFLHPRAPLMTELSRITFARQRANCPYLRIPLRFGRAKSGHWGSFAPCTDSAAPCIQAADAQRRSGAVAQSRSRAVAHTPQLRQVRASHLLTTWERRLVRSFSPPTHVSPSMCHQRDIPTPGDRVAVRGDEVEARFITLVIPSHPSFSLHSSACLCSVRTASHKTNDAHAALDSV